MGVYIFTPEDLLRYGTITEAELGVLRDAVLRKKDVLVVGSSRSGKTKLVEALIHLVPEDRKIAVITAYGEFKPFRSNIIIVDTQFDSQPLEKRTSDVIDRVKHINPDYVVIDTVRTVNVSEVLRALIDEPGFIVTSLVMTEDIKDEVKHWLGIDDDLFGRFDVVVELRREFRTGRRAVDGVYRIRDGELERVV